MFITQPHSNIEFIQMQRIIGKHRINRLFDMIIGVVRKATLNKYVVPVRKRFLGTKRQCPFSERSFYNHTHSIQIVPDFIFRLSGFIIIVENFIRGIILSQ